MSEIPSAKQELLDRFYAKHGPCCAGCDYWHWITSMVGEFHRSAPVSDLERTAMLGIKVPSLAPEAGHVMTRREHRCGDFKDEFNWHSLPAAYLRKIGRKPEQS